MVRDWSPIRGRACAELHLARLDGDARQPGLVEGEVLAQHVDEVAAAQQLHGHVEGTVLVLAEVDDLDDVVVEEMMGIALVLVDHREILVLDRDQLRRVDAQWPLDIDTDFLLQVIVQDLSHRLDSVSRALIVRL